MGPEWELDKHAGHLGGKESVFVPKPLSLLSLILMFTELMN